MGMVGMIFIVPGVQGTVFYISRSVSLNLRISHWSLECPLKGIGVSPHNSLM